MPIIITKKIAFSKECRLLIRNHNWGIQQTCLISKTLHRMRMPMRKSKNTILRDSRMPVINKRLIQPRPSRIHSSQCKRRMRLSHLRYLSANLSLIRSALWDAWTLSSSKSWWESSKLIPTGLVTRSSIWRRAFSSPEPRFTSGTGTIGTEWELLWKKMASRTLVSKLTVSDLHFDFKIKD